MEDGHWQRVHLCSTCSYSVLILIVMEDGHWLHLGVHLPCGGGLNPYCKEDGHWPVESDFCDELRFKVLILIVMEDGHWRSCGRCTSSVLANVLILIVMEDGHWQWVRRCSLLCLQSLNPYCNGRWSLTKIICQQTAKNMRCLNPYCNGRWSLTAGRTRHSRHASPVLILIVMEDGHWQHRRLYYAMDWC